MDRRELHDPLRQRVADLETAPPRGDDAVAVARDEQHVVPLVDMRPLGGAPAVRLEIVESLEIRRARLPEDDLAEATRHGKHLELLADHDELAGGEEALPHPPPDVEELHEEGRGGSRVAPPQTRGGISLVTRRNSQKRTLVCPT